jgi:hypothetical protein
LWEKWFTFWNENFGMWHLWYFWQKDQVIKGLYPQNHELFQAKQQLRLIRSLAVWPPSSPGLIVKNCIVHDLTPWCTQANPEFVFNLIYSFILLTLSFQHPRKTLFLSLYLKVKETLLVGRFCPSIPVQLRAPPVSPRRSPPSPPGISSIPLLFTHWFHSLGFNMSSMRIQFWTMYLLDWWLE